MSLTGSQPSLDELILHLMESMLVLKGLFVCQGQAGRT